VTNPGIGKRGRVRGEDHGMARLTWDRVRAIRTDYQNKKVTQRQLAKREGVSQTTIYRILKNINWVERTSDSTAS